MIMIMCMITSTMSMFMKHPLSLGITLMMQTTLISIMSGMMINMFWMSYILIMTIISGLIILFMYMASTASNEKFNAPKNTITVTATLALAMMMWLLMDQMKQKKIWSIMNYGEGEGELIPELIKLFSPHIFIMIIFLTSYLFITMIMIASIINNNEGPLRQKN